MNELEVINNKKIENMIYKIRGKEVMLDNDLAKLYGCANGTKTINLAVKRNIERFPDNFYFQLTKKEFENLKFQNETSSYGGIRKLPYVFTEQGVAMLSSVLRTKNAAKISVNIMQAFVAMRHSIIENKDIYISLNNINNELLSHKQKFIEQDNKFNELFSKFESKEQTEKIFFNGEIYDAYSKIIDIMNEAKEELIIIDNYADKTVLDMISKLKINVTLIVKTKSLLTQTDIKKYNEQYNNLKIIYDDNFHDRFIIIDRKEIYHSGASLNYAGNKIFSINKLEDKDIKNMLINKIKNLVQKNWKYNLWNKC